MPPFQRKPFLPSSFNDTVAAKYRVQLKRHPFLLFGLPFIITMVAGSFFLTPATALRYEKQDRKVRQMSQEEALGLGKDRRRVTMDVAAEEYYVSLAFLSWVPQVLGILLIAVLIYRGLQQKTWIIGSKGGLSGCLESPMVFFEGLEHG